MKNERDDDSDYGENEPDLIEIGSRVSKNNSRNRGHIKRPFIIRKNSNSNTGEQLTPRSQSCTVESRPAEDYGIYGENDEIEDDVDAGYLF